MLPPPYLAALWAATAAVAVTGFALRGGRLPDGRRLAALAGSAVVVGLVAWPWSRNTFGGQTDFLIQTLVGEVPLDGTRSRTIVPPAMELLAAALGMLPGDDPRILLLPAVLAGGVAVFGFTLAARSATGLLAPALVVGALFALDPERLVWSHAAYHVIHPTACVAVAAALLAEGARRDRDTLAVAAGLWLGLAVVIRLDVATAAAPLVAWALVLPGPSARRVRHAALLVVGAVVGAGPSFLPGSTDAVATAGWHVSEVGPALVSALGASEMGWPWLHPVVLVVLVALLARVERGARLRFGLVVLALVVAWGALATFGDFGARHTLPLRGFLLLGLSVVLAKTSALELRAGAVLLGVAALVASVPLGLAYYAPPALSDAPPSWATSDDAAPIADLVSAGCGFVAQNDEYFAGWESVDQLDLLDLLDPDLALAAWERHDGCIVWIRDDDDARWDESVRLSRSRRLRRQWRWTSAGVGRTPFGGWYAAWRLAGDSDPQAGRATFRGMRAFGEAVGLVGGPRADCMAWAAGTCRFVERCTGEADPEFARGDACMQILRGSCLSAPPRPEDTTECRRLGAEGCADRGTAKRCWDLAERF